MKKLDISAIAPGISLYPKGGTFQFLQLAYQEAFNELTTSRIGSSYDTTKGYILNGCKNSGSGSNYIISAGSIFFNGEIYLVDAATFTITGSNIAEGTIITTQYTVNADPTDFSDGTPRNVHNIRKIVFAPGLDGSGTLDFIDLVDLAYKPVGGIGQTIIWNLPAGVITDYFTAGVGSHPLTLGWNIDSTMGGNIPAAYKSADANFGTLNQVQGNLTHELIANEVPVLSVSIPLYENGTGEGSVYPAVTDNPAVPISTYTGSVNAGTPNTPISLLQPTITKLFITRIS